MTISRMKFEGRDSEGEFASASFDLDTDEFATLMLLVFYMGSADSRVPPALSAIKQLHPQLSNSRDNLRRDGKLRAMRSSASGPYLREEDLPVVRAARSRAARRGLPRSEGRTRALDTTGVQFNDDHSSDYRHQSGGVRRHDTCRRLTLGAAWRGTGAMRSHF